MNDTAPTGEPSLEEEWPIFERSPALLQSNNPIVRRRDLEIIRTITGGAETAPDRE
jgi:hypothetical protein